MNILALIRSLLPSRARVDAADRWICDRKNRWRSDDTETECRAKHEDRIENGYVSSRRQRVRTVRFGGVE